MGSLFSAISGSSKKAAHAQQTAAEQANNVAGQERDASIANFQPYLNSGVSAQGALNTGLGLAGGDTSSANYGGLTKPFTGADLANTPGYQFGLQQGNQAIDRKQASSGNYLSGAALKEGQRFAQDYAGQGFQAGYDRNAADKSRVQNFLSSVANLGQSSANSVGNIRQNFSNAFGQNTIGAGNAKAAGIMGQANAIGGSINDGLTAAIGGPSALMNRISPPPTINQNPASSAPSGAGLNPYSYLMNGMAPNSALNSMGLQFIS